MNLINIHEKYKSLIKTAGILGLMGLIYYGILQVLIINLFTIIYLIYKSISLLESDEIDTKMLNLRLKQWITYSFFMILEYGADFLFKFLPLSFFYYLFKMILFLWVIQCTDNLNKLYNSWVLYYYNKYSSELSKACDVMESLSLNYKNKINNYMKENYGHFKKIIFGYIDDLIREKIINKEDDITKLLDDQ